MILPMERLRVLLQPEIPASVSDTLLLQAFVQRHESAAFTELVRRHGPMVLAVCRRILRHYQDAEDAFQAVFLVLARRAGSITHGSKLPAWLHGVACRTAIKARALLHKRRERETAAALRRETVSDLDPAVHDWHSVLDQEIARLPEKYRLPILLCAMQGKSRQAAAEILGCSAGTVAGRFFRAKQLLARRLTSRGLTYSAPALAAFLAAESATAAVPLTLTIATVRLGHLFRLGETGSATVPGTIVTLSQGVLKTMFLNTWKPRLAVAFLFLAISAGLGYFGSAVASNPDAGPTVVAEDQPASKGKPDREPIDPNLVLQKEIQKELRLSQNQIDKLHAAWKAGKVKAADEDKAQQDLTREIDALEEKLAKLREKRDAHANKIHESQQLSLKEAIFAHLSDKAVQRLQEITLRQMSLRSLLTDPKFQARLNINDEQLKKLQEMKPRFITLTDVKADEYKLASTKLFWDLSVLENDEEVRNILTPEQRREWEKMLGAPYPAQEKADK
jgi:RNA polymerase sigma factor (sigma-70 family)